MMGDFQENMVQPDSQQAVAGTYKIEKTDTGVYLTVFPPEADGEAVKEPIVVNDLRSQGIADLSVGIIKNAIVEASGKPVKIAEKLEQTKPEIQVLVDRDRMAAYLTIVTQPNSSPVTIEEVRDKISTAGVVYGVNVESVSQAIKYPGQKVDIASALKPIDGTNASLHYFFDLSKKGHPEELADGRVDFKDLNLFTIVQQGEVLAEKILATAGTPGMDVLGQELPAKAGKDFVIPVGKNVYVEDNKIIAGIAGQMQITNNKISVSPVIEIKGDVDLSTGNIDFVGNVIVRGSVQSGFTVKAEGDIEVYGAVSGGSVEGKNVIIRMGIQGMQRGYIKAKENIASKFIENANVNAIGDVVVTDTILHSVVHAGKRVIVEGKRGLIAGGHVMAGEEIRAKIVGTQLAVATDLEVGVNPEIREEYSNLRKELKKIEVSLDQAQKA